MDTGLFILAVSLLLLSYAGMHYYLFKKICRIFPDYRKILVISLWILAGSLFVVEALTHTGLSHLAIPLAWISRFWTGYLFLFFMLSISVDFLIKIANLILKEHYLLHIKQEFRTILISMFVLIVCFFGYISAQQINVLSFTLSHSKLKQPVSIVQISDLHLDMLTNKVHLQSIVEDINALQADIIVSTGDLVDMQLDYLDGYSNILAGIKAKMGKYAVYGNHEVFAGLEKSKIFIEKSGFTLLSNEGITVDQIINIAGIDDPAASGKLLETGGEEKQILEKLAPDIFTLLLKHQPRVASDSRLKFDLQLSGHTHGGQIFPFSLLTKIAYPLPFGLSQTGPNSWLYVSKGTGTWGPPMRVFAKPEITVFYLAPESNFDVQ